MVSRAMRPRAAVVACCALAHLASGDSGSSMNAAPAAASTGVPINFDVTSVTTAELDAFRYEAFIDTLLESPLSQWEALPEAAHPPFKDDAAACAAVAAQWRRDHRNTHSLLLRMQDPPQPDRTLSARPVEVDGTPYAFVRFDATYPVSGGRALFDFLTSLDGVIVVNGPDSFDTQETRDSAGRFLAPGGVEGRITAFPNVVRASVGGIRVITSAQFEARCSPLQQTFYNFPADVPLAERPPAVQELGTDDDLPIVFAYRTSPSADPDAVDLTGVVWFPLLEGRASVFVGSGYWTLLDDRLTEALGNADAGAFIDDDFDLKMCLRKELTLDFCDGSMGGYGH